MRSSLATGGRNGRATVRSPMHSLFVVATAVGSNPSGDGHGATFAIAGAGRAT
jgi:hypothetical protein